MNDHVYKIIEIAGSSTQSIEDAVNGGIARASKSLENIRWVEVTDIRGHIADGKVAHWQVTLKLGFTLKEDEDDD
jgi:flavin-binding protein dodecin